VVCVANLFGAGLRFRHRGLPAIGTPEGNRLDSALCSLMGLLGGALMLIAAPMVAQTAVLLGCGIATFMLAAWAWLTPATAPDLVRQAYTAVLAIPITVIATAVCESSGVPLGASIVLFPVLIIACLRRARHAAFQLVWAVLVYGGYQFATLPPSAAVVGALAGGLMISMVSVMAITLRGALDRVVVELREQSQRDSLTGLLNRNGLYRTLAAWQEPTGSVILLDIDHFKQVNDVHGHQTGDETLAWFAAVLSRHVRPEDCCARLGGEEFVVIVRDGTAAAARRAEAIRAAVAAESRTLTAPVTVSAGVAYGGLDDLSPLMARADKALYSAKQNGRNRVELDGLAVPGPSPATTA
jgi:diguanylate cyclase (GGDEF)-like protein